VAKGIHILNWHHSYNQIPFSNALDELLVTIKTPVSKLLQNHLILLPTVTSINTAGAPKVNALNSCTYINHDEGCHLPSVCCTYYLHSLNIICKVHCPLGQTDICIDKVQYATNAIASQE